MAVQKQDDQHKHTFSSYVRIRDVVLKTCLGRWTIERSGERGSGISVLPAWHDDDDADMCVSDLTNGIKCSFSQAAVVSILQYGCTTWTLTKRMEKKVWWQLHKNAANNIEQVQDATPHKAAAVRPPTIHHQNIKIKRIRHAGHNWRSREVLINDVLLWTLSHGQAKAGWPARTYIQQLCLDTGCSPEDLPEPMDERGGERGSGISVLIARHGGDDDVCVSEIVCLKIALWVRIGMGECKWQRQLILLLGIRNTNSIYFAIVLYIYRPLSQFFINKSFPKHDKHEIF